jgi:hypothetical protein
MIAFFRRFYAPAPTVTVVADANVVKSV